MVLFLLVFRYLFFPFFKTYLWLSFIRNYITHSASKSWDFFLTISQSSEMDQKSRFGVGEEICMMTKWHHTTILRWKKQFYDNLAKRRKEKRSWRQKMRMWWNYTNKLGFAMDKYYRHTFTKSKFLVRSPDKMKWQKWINIESLKSPGIIKM